MSDDPQGTTPRDFVKETLDFVLHLRDDEERVQDFAFFRGLADDVDRKFDAVSYASTILEQVEATSILLTACADAADVFGSSVDYDDTTPALRAVAPAWHGTADILPPWDQVGIRLRSVTYQLEAEMEGDDYNEEHCTDLISMANDQNEIENLAVGYAEACEEGAEAAWWEENGERADHHVLVRAALVADLARRGEEFDPAGFPTNPSLRLGLDLAPAEEDEDPEDEY